MRATKVADWDDLEPLRPAHARVSNVDLAVIRLPRSSVSADDPTPATDAEATGSGDEVRVLFGRCQHRGALMSDATVEDGDRLVCGVHGSVYDARSGVNLYYEGEDLERFEAWVEDGGVWVDEDEIRAWERDHPQNFDRSAYQGSYADFEGTPEEPFNDRIHQLAEEGLTRVGHHGEVAAMGVPRDELPPGTTSRSSPPNSTGLPCSTTIRWAPAWWSAPTPAARWSWTSRSWSRT
ncbi:Rieske 2Fe-2S domain-containing protein [Nocardiopsis eucommiae]|uniref:Rieske 2Fe-2S domain-containing protein n=1 Tax=Nocardiopsis eucommiae TaxID=2831970 RepID=A0A975LBV5_9ACTN|nr:Rieske 2Fe-2S domain-containing protein [Nocardiopsis eucommiae]